MVEREVSLSAASSMWMTRHARTRTVGFSTIIRHARGCGTSTPKLMVQMLYGGNSFPLYNRVGYVARVDNHDQICW